jgi:hypothetical protein
VEVLLGWCAKCLDGRRERGKRSPALFKETVTRCERGRVCVGPCASVIPYCGTDVIAVNRALCARRHPRDVSEVVKSSETGSGYWAGWSCSVGWLIQATSGSRGG